MNGNIQVVWRETDLSSMGFGHGLVFMRRRRGRTLAFVDGFEWLDDRSSPIEVLIGPIRDYRDAALLVEIRFVLETSVAGGQVRHGQMTPSLFVGVNA